ncbi:hypothetical protein Cni_G22117 [Canna indica]|uniref:procollagen-proline 4-dioxygenase n=1 Tax=Canna indica TaxID=4628 RepID=A0AAQ3KQT2_9LILI|nr:hypothetical protein Cni_G22117 [Canna indica]
MESLRPLIVKAEARLHQPRFFLFPKSPSKTYTMALVSLLTLSVGLLILLALGVVSLPVGPLFAPSHACDHSLGEKMEGLGQRDGPWTEAISWEPRAFVYHNFLSKEECEYIIQLAMPHIKKSTVVNSTTGGSEDSSVRTSSGMFLQRGRDKIIRSIEKRISDYTFIPVEHGEGLQVLHYNVGQKYAPHLDYFADEFNIKNGGQRIATFLMYLSDVEEGGETVFPNAKVDASSLPSYNELSECGKSGLALKPKMGDALFFWSIKPDAMMDPLSLHGACPVIKGNKWSAPKWFRMHEYKV